jgi:cysteine desulfurase
MPVYLDHNATAPLRPQALAAMLPVLQGSSGNPSSVHWAGAAARTHVARARTAIAGWIGVAPDTLIFTSGATESNHAVLRSAALVRADRDEIVTCTTEHSSVLATCRELAGRGLRIREVPVTMDGRIDVDAFRCAVGERTLLASVMWTNNETGVVQPIAELAALAHERGARFHTDAAQALGKLPVDLAAAAVDFASLSAHKLGGPQGVGALYVRAGAPLEPWMRGGDQERGLRAGTENVAGIVGFGAACGAAAVELDAFARRVAALRDQLWEGLGKRVCDVYRHSPQSACAPHVLHVSFEGAPGEALVEAADLAGIAVASGSACRAGSTEPSHVLLAMGVPAELRRCALRFSLGPTTSAADIEYVLDVLPDLVERVRAAERR